MIYTTKYDYDKYSIDETVIEEWLSLLYQNSALKYEERCRKYKKIVAESDRKSFFDAIYAEKFNRVNIENKDRLPFIIEKIDEFLYFLVSKGYVNENNFSGVFGSLVSNVDSVLPLFETDPLLCSFGESVIGLSDNEEFADESILLAYVDKKKTLRIHQECLSDPVLFDCVFNSLIEVIVQDRISESLKYYEDHKNDFSDLIMKNTDFDWNIYNAFEFIRYCVLYEMDEENKSYNYKYKRENNDRYKSVLTTDATEVRSFQDEIRVIMAEFIRSDSDISNDNKRVSSMINSFTKKFLEGNYLENRCHDMSDEEKNAFFTTLYNLGSLYFAIPFSGIDNNTELAIKNYDLLTQSVNKVLQNEGINTNGKKNN